MDHVSCPTSIVQAPIETVWSLLTRPERWGEFYDVRIVSVIPPGVASSGQMVDARTGPHLLRLKVQFAFFKVDPAAYELGLDVRLPLGIRVRENMKCVPLEGSRCRVTYNCAFDFPRGLRGALVRRVLRRELDAGPANSLARLKRAAEKQSGFVQ